MKKYLLIAFGCVLLDQITKLMVLLKLQTPLSIVGKNVMLLFQTNENIAFSIPFPTMILIPLQCLILIIGSILSYFYLDWNNKYYGLGFALILGGGTGNVIDRLVHGSVIDFIKIGIWPTFNIADTCITLGAILIIWGSYKPKKKN